MGQSLSSRGTLKPVICQQLGYEVFSFIADTSPITFVKRVATLADLLHDLLVTRTIEGRQACEERVKDDATGPDVTLSVVALVQHFRCYVVGRPQFLLELRLWVVNGRGAKVDNFDLIELFVLLKQDVFRFEVTVNDVVLVAVVDT